MAEPLSRKALSALIGSIYDCALDPDRWDRTLIELRDAFEGETAGLFLFSHGRIVLSRTIGVEPNRMSEVEKYAPEINAQLEEAFAERLSLDEPHVISRHLSRAYIEASPYFQHCVAPFGIVDGITCCLMRTPTHLSDFSVERHEQNGIYTAREVELARLLLPHLRRAVTISNVLEARAIERARIAEALNALRCGVVLVNARGAILHANRAAEGMLRNEEPLRSVRGMLQARAPAAARELRDAIGLAARDESAIGKRGLAIRLSDPDAAPAFAHVLPLTGSDFRAQLRPEATAAVFIADTADTRDWARAVAGVFGLTPAETRLLAALLGGQRLAEAAADLRIATTTARTHLDSIFLKTGVTRQAELMRLALQVAPPAGAPAAGA